MTRAILVSAPGGPEVLEPSEITVRDPGPGEVKIAAKAAGVNFIDVYRRNGTYRLPLPNVPGLEGTGTITAVGDGVDTVKVGDRVAWLDIEGSYAAEVVGQASKLIPVPQGIGDELAAAIPLQGMTAHYLTHDSYRIADGDTVLIHAGAGGVGLLLTQIAKIRGARVITTVSSETKAELCQGAGADEVLVGYDGFDEKVRALTHGEGVQAVYDGVGKDTFDSSLASLAIRGTMVLFGGASGQVPPFDPQRLNTGGSLTLTRPTVVHFTRTHEELIRRSVDIFGWIGGGRLNVRIGASYPLAEARRAHEELESRRTTGKVVLTISDQFRN